ncbi:MAG: phospholipase D-like domain-containing protein [Bacteroidetes bacterium]|nr:phospholipase D-like domain-containing protein [Bacteroidota bacterium]
MNKETLPENTVSGNKGNSSAKLIHGGKDYFSLLIQLISTAKDCIHLQTYIYDDDETGRMVGDALKAAALRKVKVFLVVDGYASRVMSGKYIDELKASGIQFRFFEPFFRSSHFYFGRRMHHKIFVADATFSLVGGINISNHYNDLPGNNAWLDFALYAEGDIAAELTVFCDSTWHLSSPVPIKIPGEESSRKVDTVRKKNQHIYIRHNDWVRNKNQISATYIKMLGNAKSHIRIMCSYFLPGRVIRRLLGNASRRGVQITIITAGNSDVKITKYAERWLYDWLLRHNITLYEYQPTILHAKMATCDSEWMTIGSYNINNVSAYASIELNLDVYDPIFTSSVEKVIDEIIAKDCIRITEKNIEKNKHPFRQFLQWFSYQAIRLILFLITFYYRQEKTRLAK